MTDPVTETKFIDSLAALTRTVEAQNKIIERQRHDLDVARSDAELYKRWREQEKPQLKRLKVVNCKLRAKLKKAMAIVECVADPSLNPAVLKSDAAKILLDKRSH